MENEESRDKTSCCWKEQKGIDLVTYEEVDKQEEPIEEARNQQVTSSYVGTSTTLSSSFQDMLLKPELVSASREAGFEHPSEVQHLAIPAGMAGTDVICQAKSVMGKTTVFILVTLQMIKPKDGEVDTLVLVHTKKLAIKIAAEFARFAKYLKAANSVKIGVATGGVPFKVNRSMIEEEKPHILICTPGRLWHLMQEKVGNFTKVQRFIMDECDTMLLELKTRRQLLKSFRATPKTKQVMLFFETVSDEVKNLCHKFTKNAVEIYAYNKLTLEGLQQYYVKLSEAEKNMKLNYLLDTLEFNQLVIFVKSRQQASKVHSFLCKCAFPSTCVHGAMSQPQRSNFYRKLKNLEIRILVSTNLFGRTVDIGRFDIVINYDMPDNSDNYMRRVSQLGRNGSKGLVISFISSNDEQTFLFTIQSWFEFRLEPLPNEIDTKTYM
jgi:ATP-dependent RNA helicase UAP56/SUB2